MAGGLQDLAVARANLLWIPPKHLIPDPDNERTDYGDVPQLAKEIADRGLDHPLKVRLVDADGGKKKAMVADGHRRLRAILYAMEHLGAKIESVPCYPEARGTSPDQRVIERVVGNEGQKPFTPLEEAAAFKRLVTMGVQHPEIAKRTGKKLGYIQDRLELLAAPKEVRDAVDQGRVKPSAARALSKATPEKRKAILKQTEAPAPGGKAPRVTAAQVKRDIGMRVRVTSQAEMQKIEAKAAEILGEHAPGDRSADMWSGFMAATRVFLGKISFEDCLAKWEESRDFVGIVE